MILILFLNGCAHTRGMTPKCIPCGSSAALPITITNLEHEGMIEKYKHPTKENEKNLSIITANKIANYNEAWSKYCD